MSGLTMLLLSLPENTKIVGKMNGFGGRDACPGTRGARVHRSPDYVYKLLDQADELGLMR